MKDQQVGHYKILEKLGSGGMGEVWLAEDTRLERKVALKFLPHFAAQDETEKARFIQEAKVAARLSHANIAQVYEINEEDGRLYIVMEFVEGGSLSDKLMEMGKRSLPLEDVLTWIQQAAEGLIEAHRQGIIHRDIKPDNLMLTHTGQIKITDFGLARLETATRLTASGATLGTINYMSPEQVVGKNVDERADLFSLGATFYELLTGSQPFAGPDANAIYYSILHEEPDPAYRYRRDIDQSLDLIITKLLQKDPDYRYQHADEVAADIRRASAELISDTSLPRHRPAAAKPRPRARKGRKVNRIILTLILVVAAAGIGYFAPQILQPSEDPTEGALEEPLEVSSMESTSTAMNPQDSLAAVGQNELLEGILGYMAESTRLYARMDSIQAQLEEERRISREQRTVPDERFEEATTQELQLLRAQYDSVMSLVVQGPTGKQPELSIQETVTSLVGDIEVSSPLPGGTVNSPNISIDVSVTPRRVVERLIITVDGKEQSDHPVGNDEQFSLTMEADLGQPGRHVVNVLVEDDEGNRSASPFIITYTPESEEILIGVLDLDINNVDAAEGLAVSERLRIWLGRQNLLQVLSRKSMESILSEIGFQYSGACNTLECVTQIGRILGVQKMVAGSVSRVGSMYSVQIRSIDIETTSIEHQAYKDVSGGIEEVLTTAVRDVADDLAGAMVENTSQGPVRIEVGRVDINTDPEGAAVTVDGEEMGETPLQLTLPVGSHIVQLNKEGFYPVSRRIEITSEDPEHLTIPLEEVQPIIIGLVDLTPNGIDEGEARAISERLRVFLANQSIFQVIERNQMESIMNELGFQSFPADITNEAVFQLGQILGASKMVAGSISKVGTLYSLQVRIFDVATSRIEYQLFKDVMGIEQVLRTATLEVASDLARAVTERMIREPPPPS